MSIYQTRWFDRWARKQKLTTSSLCVALREMMAGLYDADLGGGLVKKRIARPGQGEAWRLSNLGRHEQGKSVGVRVRFPEKRTQQHRQG
jgi:hypothetical protein